MDIYKEKMEKIYKEKIFTNSIKEQAVGPKTISS